MKIFKNCLSLVLSFLLMILVIVLIYIFNISSFATKGKMIRNVQHINFAVALKKVRNSGKVSDNTKISNTINDLYNLASEFDVKSEDIDKIINSKITKKIIGISLGNMTDFIINGNKSKIFSSEDIYNIISYDIDDVLKNNDIDISEGQKEKFLNRIKLELPDLAESIPNVDDVLSSKYKDMISILQLIFSNNSKVIICIVVCVLILIMILIEGKKCIQYIGFSFLFASLLSIVISFFIPSLVLELVMGVDISLLVNPFVSLLSRNIVNWSIISLFFSIILLLISKDIYRLDG